MSTYIYTFSYIRLMKPSANSVVKLAMNRCMHRRYHDWYFCDWV